MPVNIPGQQDRSGLGTVVPMAGGIIGGMFGGPGGAIAGQKVGAAMTQQGPAPGAVGEDGSQNALAKTDPGAIQRRMQNLQSQPSAQLSEAAAALKQLPPEYQQQYGPTIAAAQQVDAQGGN